MPLRIRAESSDRFYGGINQIESRALACHTACKAIRGAPPGPEFINRVYGDADAYRVF